MATKKATVAQEASPTMPDQLDPGAIQETNSANDTVEETAVTARDPRGNAHRTFSQEVHGENFRQLAETYVSSRPGWTVSTLT